MGRWRARAKKILFDACREAEQQGIHGRALRRFLASHYMAYASTREKYPYRVWCEEVDSIMTSELSKVKQIRLF